MPTLKWPKDVATWIAFAILLLTAVNAFLQKDYQAASVSLGAALALIGIGQQAATAAAFAASADRKAGFAAADTMAMRNDPAMPGPAITSVEATQRSQESK